MAGSVLVSKLGKPLPHQMLLDGTHLWKWDEGDPNPQKLLFKVDKRGFYLHARGEDTSKGALVWDLVLVSDVRQGKMPKDTKVIASLNTALNTVVQEPCCLSLVYRVDGITKLSFTNLIAESVDTAKLFQTSVNGLAHHLLDYHASTHTYLIKHYTRVLLEANGDGELPIRKIREHMLVPKGSKEITNYLESSKTIVRESKKGKPYVLVDEFTEEIFMNMVDSLLQNRGPDLDELKQSVNIKARKQYMSVSEFVDFLNNYQRDPRLNDILYPRTTPEQGSQLIEKYGNDTDRLTMRDLLLYLMSDDNMVLDTSIHDRHMDMSRPLNLYFINSSHNSYLNGHQLRSESLAEMYSQILLTGCRCVELDCWPSSDYEEIMITHGNTLCTKILFRDVVEAINQFAFVASEYPVILSIENHCNKYPKLIAKMAEIFIEVFGDKLMSCPLEDHPLEAGVPLPSPDKLKYKILIKDKIRQPKGSNPMATLTRGATLTEVPEETPDDVEAQKKEEKQEKEEEKKQEEQEKAEPEKKQDELKPLATKPPPLLNRPSLIKGMTILEEPVAQGDKKLRKGVSVITEEPPETPPSSNPRKESIQSIDSTSNGGSTLVLPNPDRGKMIKTPSTESTSSDDGKKKYESGEASNSGPLNELLNYTTALSFESFEASERLNSHYIMSSFAEEKGLNQIKTKPKEFVRYNMRQNSRVYPAGARITSSNYMPQIYWNVGCQMVALNFQTSDMPMQLNYSKFEMNGGSGYILKPTVMCMEKGFNPFVQKKLEDIVPVRMSIKVISGMFITDKKTNLIVEVEMYGLPADTVRRQFTKKRSPAPHPFWAEDYFVFRRVLLPELAMLRLVVMDDDHVLVGQRMLPCNYLRAGFRHVSLRDKHNNPLGSASLFVHIKIEDYVPDEYEEFVMAITNPLQFATKALEQLAIGTGENEDEGPGSDQTDSSNNGGPSSQKDGPSGPSVTVPSLKDRRDSAPPELIIQPPIAPIQRSTTESAATGIKKDAATKTLPSGLGSDSLKCILDAKNRSKMYALEGTSSTVMEHTDYVKLTKKLTKSRSDLLKKQEKARKTLSTRHSKEIGKIKNESDKSAMADDHKKQMTDFEESIKKELRDFDRATKSEQHEKQRWLLNVTHDVQRKSIDKTHKSDVANVQSELAQELKQKKKAEGKNSSKDWMRGVEQELFRMGMQARSDLDIIHKRELQTFEQSVEEAVQNLEKAHRNEMEELDSNSP